MAGGTLFAPLYQEAHLVVTNPAETCGVFVCPFEFYQEGRQHCAVEASAVVEAHHLDFNMIEHCHYLCCLDEGEWQYRPIGATSRIPGMMVSNDHNRPVVPQAGRGQT